ncbi:MAG: hypothetical protein R3C97_13570 [Geminicoccaceae bacterium]
MALAAVDGTWLEGCARRSAFRILDFATFVAGQRRERFLARDL